MEVYRPLILGAHLYCPDSPFYKLPKEVIVEILKHVQEPTNLKDYFRIIHGSVYTQKLNKVLWELHEVFSTYDRTIPQIINKEYTASESFHCGTQWVHFKTEMTPAGLVNSVNNSAAYYSMLTHLGDYNMTGLSISERKLLINSNVIFAEYNGIYGRDMGNMENLVRGGDWCNRLVMKNAIYILTTREKLDKFLEYKAWYLRDFGWKDIKFNNTPVGERILIKSMIRANMPSVFDGIIRIL